MKPAAVNLQKYDRQSGTDSFVPIDKRVIFSQTEGVGGREFKDAWLAASEKILRPSQRRIQQPLIADAGRAAEFG